MKFIQTTQMLICKFSVNVNQISGQLQYYLIQDCMSNDDSHDPGSSLFRNIIVYLYPLTKFFLQHGLPREGVVTIPWNLKVNTQNTSKLCSTIVWLSSFHTYQNKYKHSTMTPQTRPIQK